MNKSLISTSNKRQQITQVIYTQVSVHAGHGEPLHTANHTANHGYFSLLPVEVIHYIIYTHTSSFATPTHTHTYTLLTNPHEGELGGSLVFNIAIAGSGSGYHIPFPSSSAPPKTTTEFS